MAILYRKSTNSTIRLMQSLSIGVSLFVGCSQGFAQVMFTDDFESGLASSTSYIVSTYDAASNTSIQSASASAMTQAVPPGGTWTTSRDFESGALGTKANNTPDGFDHDANGSLYTNAQAASGNQSAIIQINANTTGFGYWGGYIDFPKTVGKGNIIYFSANYYLPSSFIVDSGNGSLKWLRFYTLNPAGTNANTRNGGALDIQLKDRSVGIRMIKEIDNKWFNVTNSIPIDKWFNIKAEIGVSDVLRNNGGNSYVKIWLDGVLVADNGAIQTLNTANDYYINFLLHTYYNSNAPQTQYSYVDDIYISTAGPSGTPPPNTNFDPPSAPIAQ